MDRRAFLSGTAATLATLPAAQRALAEGAAGNAPVFATGNARWQAAYDKALAVVAANVRVMHRVG